MEFLQPAKSLLQASRAVYGHEAHRYSAREGRQSSGNVANFAGLRECGI